MPRKATSIHADVAPAITKINNYCKSTTTSILSLSKKAGVGQPALFRFINGERKSITPAARKVLLFIDGRHNWHNQHKNAILDSSQDVNLEGQSIIENAISALWDGKRQSAELIASLVLALRPALEIALHANLSGQKGN